MGPTFTSTDACPISQVPIRSDSMISPAFSQELTNKMEAIRLNRMTGFTNDFLITAYFRFALRGTSMAPSYEYVTGKP